MHDRTKFVSALAITALIAASAPATAQATNEGKPAAPSPSKAAPLETSGKPSTMKGDGGGASKGMMKSKTKKKRRH